MRKYKEERISKNIVFIKSKLVLLNSQATSESKEKSQNIIK